MRREAIPLFESSIDGVFEDYQLYPSYSWLTKGKITKDPDLDFYHLSCVENTEPQMPRLFMPLGRPSVACSSTRIMAIILISVVTAIAPASQGGQAMRYL